MGSIYQRGKIYWIGYVDARGKQHCESSRLPGVRPGTNFEAAKRLLQQREGKIADGVPVTSATGRMKFDEAVQDVLRDHRANDRRSTVDVERRIKLHLLPVFGGLRLTTINTDMIRAYIDRRLGQGAENATINRELAIIRRAFRLAHDAGHVVAIPKIKMLDESRNVRKGFFEADEFDKVRAALTPTVYADAAEFAAITGWRLRSDVLTLTWSQIDRRGGTIRIDVGVTKGGEGRVFPLLARLRQIVAGRDRARHNGCELVFHEDGQPIAPRNFHRRWQAACEVAGLKDRIPHDLRRSAVRMLERAGVSRKVAMQMVGHKTESIYRRYHIVADSDVREAGARLEALTDGKAVTTNLLQSRRRSGLPRARKAKKR